MRSHSLAMCMMVCLFWPIGGKAQTDPEIRQFSQAELESMGQQIFYQDEQAARATDFLFAQKDQKVLEAEKVRGWIVDPSLVSTTVRFVRDGDNGLEAAYDIIFAEAASPHISVPVDRTLTAEEKAQFAARILALKNIERPCSDHYNTVVLKDPEGDGWLVWALAATTEPQTWFIGGNYRFTFSKDGTTIQRRDALSRGCLTMKAPQENGKKLAAQFAIQLVSNIPVETAIWVNLQSKLPLIVVTPDRVEWGIDAGKMSKLGVLPDKNHAAPR